MPRPLQKLAPIHHRIIRLLLTGLKCVDVAKIVGYHPQRVAEFCSQKVFKAEMDRLQKEMTDDFKGDIRKAREKLAREMDPSINKLIELRDKAESQHVQRDSASQIIDRGPLGKAEEKIKARIELHPTPEMMDVISEIEDEDNEKETKGKTP